MIATAPERLMIPYLKRQKEPGEPPVNFDLIVRGATLPDGRAGQDIAISGGRIAAVEPNIAADDLNASVLARA